MTAILPKLTVLIVHYQRTSLAINAINSIRRLGLNDVEYILSDDGSRYMDVERLRPYFDTIVISSKNKGLGHNMNQGIMLSRGEYILVMQEDTEYTGSKKDLVNAMAALDEHTRLQFIRFYGYKLVEANKDAVTVQEVAKSHTEVHTIDHKHPLFKGDAYSDMPHLRRNPCRQSGHWMYAEDCRMEQTERDYIGRFAKGDQRVAFLYSSRDLVVHQGRLSSHRISQWDYKLTRQIKRACDGMGVNTKHPVLRPIRKIIINFLPHARITYKD